MIFKNSNDDTCISETQIGGWIEITEDEADLIRESRRIHEHHPETIAEKLTALDAANTLTQRNLRESIMLMAEAIKTINHAVDLTLIPGVAKVYDVEAQAAVLRAQL